MNPPSTFPGDRVRPVWIASYPRSGNTFLRILFESIFRLPTYSLYRIEGQDFPDPSAEALQQAPFLPANWRQLVTAAPEAPPILVKTHDPPEDNSPAIYIVRDGREVVDSYFHYHQKFGFEKPSLTEVIAGACQFGSWSAHYLAWDPKRRPNTLFLTYEELVTRPDQIIPRVAEFLRSPSFAAGLPSFAELQARSPAFFRRGPNQNYLREWTPEQLALFNACHGKVMADLGYTILGSTESERSTAVELAGSAARLHQQYLQQLQKLGAAAASQRELAQQVIDHSAKLNATNSLLSEQNAALAQLRNRAWIRVGELLGVVRWQRNGKDAASVAGESVKSGTVKKEAPKP